MSIRKIIEGTKAKEIMVASVNKKSLIDVLLADNCECFPTQGKRMGLRMLSPPLNPTLCLSLCFLT